MEKIEKVATATNLTERVKNVVKIISKFDLATTNHYISVMNANWRKALTDYLGTSDDVEDIYNAIKNLNVKNEVDEDEIVHEAA